MPSLLGEEQDLLLQSAVRLLQEQRDAGPAALWREIAAAGWLELCLPPALDGPAHAVLSAFTLMEVLGMAGVQAPLAAVLLAAWLLRDAGCAAAQAGLLTQLASGRVLVVPATVDAPGETPARYVRDGSTQRIDGAKRFVEFAASADTLLVSAAPNAAAGEPALFLVPSDANGVQIEPMPSAGGEYLAAVRFDRVAVSEPLVAGAPVAEALRRLSLHGAALRAAELAGTGRAALELTLRYVQTRTQFGRPIGSFQAVQHHCADMLRDLVATRLLVAQAAWRLQEGLPATREVAMAKAKASEAIPAVLRLAHQGTGGVGYYRDYPLEGFYRRALDAAAAFGGPLEHRRTLAELAAGNPAALRRPDGHPQELPPPEASS